MIRTLTWMLAASALVCSTVGAAEVSLKPYERSSTLCSGAIAGNHHAWSMNPIRRNTVFLRVIGRSGSPGSMRLPYHTIPTPFTG